MASDNTPVPVNQQTTSETQPDTTQPEQPHNIASIPTNPVTPKQQSKKTLPNITPIPQSYDTPDETQKHTQQQKIQEKPTQQIQQQSQKDNRQIQSTEQQPPKPEPQTLTKTTTPQPTLTPFEKQTLPSKHLLVLKTSSGRLQDMS